MEKFGKDIKNKKLKDSIVEAQRVALAGIPINFPKNIENKVFYSLFYEFNI